MKLFICEKPSQARDIAGVIDDSFKKQESHLEGSSVVVTWCYGHLLELAPPDDYCENLKPWRVDVLPVIPSQWVTKAQKKTKKQLNAIGKLLKKATEVVIATDADREGDVIGREVLDYFNYQGPVSRLWLSALDEASIKKALADIRPGSSTECLYQAGLGRQRADWLIGMNLTMATSSLFGGFGQGVLSVGRVQTPTLKLVVDRDLEIEQFKPKDYFVVKAEFQTTELDKFWTTWEVPHDYSDEQGRCIKQDYASAVIKKIENQEACVQHFKEAPKKTAPPLCFSLSSLQKLGSAQFGLGAKEVLDIAQSLYEKHKATTYPRTDCGYLPESQFSEASQILSALQAIDESLTPLIAQCDVHTKSKVWNDKKITAHHGIIPTLNDSVDITQMSLKEKQLYDVIRRHYIAQFLGDYEFLQRQVIVECQSHTFKASQSTPVYPGWKQAITENAEASEEVEGSLPKLSNGQELTNSQAKQESKKTKPPARFSEGTLITAMKSIAKYVDDANLKKVLKETAGIGTEATRANIIETLINRDYVAKKGKQLISTKRGRELIKLLPASITNPSTTALWEQQLDAIAEGSSEISDFLDDQQDALEGMIEQLALLAKKTGAFEEVKTQPCPDCDKSMTRRKGKKGYWWGCTGYPDCKTTAFDEKGKPKFVTQRKKPQASKPFIKPASSEPLNLLG